MVKLIKAGCWGVLVNKQFVGMMISEGKFGITASNSDFSPCVFPVQQTHILSLPRNGCAIIIFVLQVSSIPGACLASHLSVCVQHTEPSLAMWVKLQTNHTWKEGGKAFSLWKIAADMHPAILGFDKSFHMVQCMSIKQPVLCYHRLAIAD